MAVRTWFVLAAALCASALAACGGGPGAAPASAERSSESGAPNVVVATTTIVGDIVARMSCGRVEVETLLKPGQDPHSVDLSARQAADLRDARLVVAIGLGLEESFTDVLLDARDEGTSVLFLGPQLEPIPLSALEQHEHRDEFDAGEHGGPLDPHLWTDPRRMIEAVGLIEAELSLQTGDDYAACAAEYIAELERLDRDIAARLASVPVESRRLLTNHAAMGYFAERYGFTIVDTVIPGGTTLAEPSSADIVELIETVDETGVDAIFADVSASSDVARLVAAEASARVDVVLLFSGALGEPGSEAESYVAMMRTNVERIAAALGDAR